MNKIFGSLTRLGIAACAAGTLMGWAGIATANPISFIPAGTDISIKFVDREVLITGVGQELFGLVNITQINNADSSVTFWNGNGVSDGTQLVGYFEGLTSVADQTGGAGLSFTGGQFVLYSVPNGTYSPSTNPNTKDYANQLCGGACGTPWLTADFVPGINDAFGPAADASLQAALATSNVQAGFGYLSVTGGTYASTFDTDTYTFLNFNPADLFLRSNFVIAGSQACPTNTANGWQVCSDDPVAGHTAPEPGTIALLGLALLAGGAIRRRKAA